MNVTCEISVGELLDRYSILLIKQSKIKDLEKLKFIQAELNKLNHHKIIDDAASFVTELFDCNLLSWDNNDKRKEKIKNNQIDDDFVKMCLFESKINDERFLIKKKIDIFFNSEIKEQKNHL